MPDPQFDGRSLYHVRNVFLLSDGDQIFEIQEPIKWGDIDITIKWDVLTKGFKFEFTDGDVLLEFDEAAGRAQILAQYEDKFQAMKMSLKFGELDSANVLTILFEAKLNFDSIMINKYTVKANCERVSFADKFRLRFSTPTDILGQVSIGGLNLPPLTMRELFLHPRLLTHRAEFIYNEGVNPVGIELTKEIDDGPGDDPEWDTTVPPFKATTNNIDGLEEPLVPSGELLYTGLNLPPGVQKRVIFFDFYAAFKFTMGNTSQFIKAGVSVYKRSNISGGGNGDFPPIAQTAGNVNVVYSEDCGNVASVQTIVAQANGVIELGADEAVFIKAWVFTPGNTLFPISNFQWLNLGDHYLFANEQTITKSSLATVPMIHEAVNRQLELILDTTTPLRSNFLGRIDLGYAANGCAAYHTLASGLMVRNFKNRAFNMSANQWFSSLSKIFCMGLSCERDNDNNEFIRFEPLEYFFRNVLLLRFDTISKYEKKPALQYLDNEMKFAFSKFPQNDQADSLEDWMTEMNYIMPSATTNGKMDQTIDFLLSAYYLEYTRLQGFAIKPTNSYETDANIFMVSTAEGSQYNGKNIVFDQVNNKITIMDIVAIVQGEQFTIAGATGGVTNGMYVANSIEIPYAYDRTIITVTGPLATNGAGTGNVSVAPNRLKAKRNEDFSSTVNVPNPKSVYNLEHHLGRIMLRWAKVFNAGMYRQYDTANGINFVAGRNNTNIYTVLRDEVTCRYGSVREGVADSGNFVARTNLQVSLFKANIITFEAPLTWETLNILRMAFEGRHPEGKDYGYFEWPNLNGVTEKGFILSLGFKPTTQMVKAQFIEKYDA